MIDGSEKRNRQLVFELQNSHVCEKRNNIMGDELRQRSWIFDMFILDRIDRELHSLKCLDLKFGL